MGRDRRPEEEYRALAKSKRQCLLKRDEKEMNNAVVGRMLVITRNLSAACLNARKMAEGQRVSRRNGLNGKISR